MKNSGSPHDAGRTGRPALGPAPAPRRDPTASLSESRADLLDHLRLRAEPSTLATLAAAAGLHVNTVREHLDALVRQGLARRHRRAPRGRGRPAWLYEAAGDDTGSGSSEYAGLATALAAAIHRNSISPRADAVAAGTEWGRDLARDRGPGSAGGDAHRRVLDLLEDLGFAPETDDDRAAVRLTRCPLLEAARRHTEVVCGVHLGIVRGALAEYDAPAAGTDLHSFAEPGACLLELPAPPAPATR